MKLISVLLAAYVGFLSIHPVMIKVENNALPIESAGPLVCSEQAEMICCEEGTERQEDRSCFPEDCSAPCPACICGLYCLCCVLQTPYHLMDAAESPTKLNGAAALPLVSNYHSECFRPPEVA